MQDICDQRLLHRETVGLEGGFFLTFWRRPKLCMGGGKFFEDGYISVSKFRFLPEIFGGRNLLPISRSPPLNDSCVQTAVGIAVTDHCRHLLICFATSPRWAPAAIFA